MQDPECRDEPEQSGRALLAAGPYADAERLASSALEIREKTFGPDNPSVATSLDNLAVLYVDQGRCATPSSSRRARWRFDRKRWARTIWR